MLQRLRGSNQYRSQVVHIYVNVDHPDLFTSRSSCLNLYFDFRGRNTTLLSVNFAKLALHVTPPTFTGGGLLSLLVIIAGR
jgi:hypothetical protein